MTIEAAPRIRGEGLSRIYEQAGLRVEALRDVDLDIDAGELVALVGASGSGKSTLLNLLGCLDRPTAGDLRYDGVSVLGRSKAEEARFRRRHIGFVFQAFNLVPVLSAYENAELGLVLERRSRAERRRLVSPLFERVGLAGLEDRRPHELSGGQQQRVAVIRALAVEPRVVLADEPTANLDTATTASLLDLFVDLNRERGTTFVLASHDPAVRERARRVVELSDGRLV